jgi:hypothetical protein
MFSSYMYLCEADNKRSLVDGLFCCSEIFWAEKRVVTRIFEAQPARRGKLLKHWRLGLLEKEISRVLSD